MRGGVACPADKTLMAAAMSALYEVDTVIIGDLRRLESMPPMAQMQPMQSGVTVAYKNVLTQAIGSNTKQGLTGISIVMNQFVSCIPNGRTINRTKGEPGPKGRIDNAVSALKAYKNSIPDKTFITQIDEVVAQFIKIRDAIDNIDNTTAKASTAKTPTNATATASTAKTPTNATAKAAAEKAVVEKATALMALQTASAALQKESGAQASSALQTASAAKASAATASMALQTASAALQRESGAQASSALQTASAAAAKAEDDAKSTFITQFSNYTAAAETFASTTKDRRLKQIVSDSVTSLNMLLPPSLKPKMGGTRRRSRRRRSTCQR